MASAPDMSDNLSATLSCVGREPVVVAKSLWLDRLGIVLSLVCAVHCALTPVLVAVAPLLFSAEFEWRTKVVLVALASVAVLIGFVSHRSFVPLYWLGVALSLLGLGHYCETLGENSVAETLEIVTTVVASGALIMAHLANSRACRTAAPHSH